MNLKREILRRGRKCELKMSQWKHCWTSWQMLQTQDYDHGTDFLRSQRHAGVIHTKSTARSLIFRQSVNQMFLHICPWSQFGRGGGLKRGDEINSLSEAENNSIAGSLLASQMLRRLQDQQLPSAPHRHADDKLKLRHQCLDGRARGVGGGKKIRWVGE